MRIIVPAFVIVLGLSRIATAQPSERITNAIQAHESGGDVNCADGDGGKAIGAFQIHRGAWLDAVRFDKSIGGKYEDCRDPAYARRIFIAYVTRWGGKNVTDEQAARIWNGGPRIYKRAGSSAWNNTTKYWEKVKKFLK